MTKLNAVSSVFGAILILGYLLSLLLYETEEGLFQNKLEVLWIRLSYAGSAALSKQANFIRAVAGLTDAFFDRVFGVALISSRSVAVSACFSIVSLGIVCSPGINDFPLLDIGVAFYVPFVMLLSVAGILPAVLGNRLPRKMWLLGVALLCFIAFVGMYSLDWFNAVFSSDPFRELKYDVAFLVLTIGCDTLFVVATRWLLRKASSLHSGVRILAVVLGNISIAGVLVLLPLIGPLRPSGALNLWKARHDLVKFFERQALSATPGNIFLLTLAGSNLFDAAVAFAFVGLFLVMLIHRLLWPALQRPVYAIAKGGLVRHRKLLFIFGATLLALGMPAGPVVRLGGFLKRIAEAILSSS
jgi:hypothetical protein